MNLRTVFKHTCADFIAGNAVIWKGPPGFGKTDLTNKVFDWLRKQNPGKRVGLSCFFMATQSEIGFTGLPWKGERDYGDGKIVTVTDPAVPQWYMATDPETGQRLPASMFDLVLLVIEEWGQGSAETKRAGAEVLRAGGTPPWYLPPGSPRLALTNVDSRDGVTKEFDFIIGRRGEYEISGDADVWIEDFADKPYSWGGKPWEVMPFTKAFAKQHPEILFEPKPDKQGPWCNPRTLCMADRYAQVIAQFNGAPDGSTAAQLEGFIPVNDADFTSGLAGKIGMAAATQYVGDLQFLVELPKYEAVVADPEGTPVPKKADLLMLMAYKMAGMAKVEDLKSVLQYISRLPKDMSVTFVSSLLRRDYKRFTTEPAMAAWISKNAQLISIIATLAT